MVEEHDYEEQILRSRAHVRRRDEATNIATKLLRKLSTNARKAVGSFKAVTGFAGHIIVFTGT